jgi:hypothetical protein
MIKNKIIFLFIAILNISLLVTEVFSGQNEIKRIPKHYLEIRYEKSVVSVCNKAGIGVKIMPVIYRGKRSLFVYFEDNANTENLLAASKLIGARYLLPLMRDLVALKIKKVNYYSLIINIKGRGKLLSANMLPHLAISYAANKIDKTRFLKRCNVKISVY